MHLCVIHQALLEIPFPGKIGGKIAKKVGEVLQEEFQGLIKVRAI